MKQYSLSQKGVGGFQLLTLLLPYSVAIEIFMMIYLSDLLHIQNFCISDSKLLSSYNSFLYTFIANPWEGLHLAQSYRGGFFFGLESVLYD